MSTTIYVLRLAGGNWYVGKTNDSKSTIVDELNNVIELNIKTIPFIPNYKIVEISKLLTTEDGMHVIYSSSKYDTRKPYMSIKKSKEYKYPIVHEMNQKGIGYRWTNKPDFDDHTDQKQFLVPKVILSFNRSQYPYNDHEGEYGMSQIAFGLPIESKKQGDAIVKAINSEEFADIIKATKWGSFQTNYKMFRFFKKDFWKQFVPHSKGGKYTMRRNKYMRNITYKK